MPGGLAAGQLVDERYALEELLEEGALGNLWRAFDRGLGRAVCVREVRFPGREPAADREWLQGALRVARIAIRVDHPGAVHVYDAFLDRDQLVVVTEPAPSRTLVAVVQRKGGLPAKRVAAIALELLDALAAAHAAGVVHGGICPAAVLVPDRGRAQLTGFGLAPPFADDSAAAWAEAAGSANCVAPEQLGLDGNSAAADLWSLGATLYYAAEGTHAFEAGAARSKSYRPMAKAGALAPVLEQLLVADPGARPRPDAIRPALADIAGVSAAEEAAEARRRWRRDRRRGEAGGATGEAEAADEAAPGTAEPVERDWGAAVIASPGRPAAGGAGGAGGGTANGDGEPAWVDWSPGEVVADASDLWLPPGDGGPTVRTTGPADAEPAEPAGAGAEPGAATEPATGAEVEGAAWSGPATPPPPAEPPPESAPARLQLVPALGADAPNDVPEPVATGPAPASTADVAGEPRQFRATPSWPPPEGRRKLSVVVLCSAIMLVMLALLVTNGRLLRNGGTSATTLSAKQRPVLGVDPESVPSNWIAYRHPAVDFGLSYPPGWAVREEGQVVNIRDAASGAELRVEHSTPPGRDPEQTFLELERGFYAAHPTDYRRLQLSPASYLGHVGALWEFTYQDGPVAVHAVDLGFLTKDYRFTLEFRAPSARWEEMLPVFHGYLGSFRAPK